MIKKISIKNVASYDNAGAQFNDLKKINFIYGANGSGKTTISNCAAEQSNSEFKDCTIDWEHGQKLTSLVYNKQFRENNFGKGKIDGVFTLGKATQEDILKIEEKQEQLKILKDEGIKKKETLDKQEKSKLDNENSFKENSWAKIYKKYEDAFKEAFQGSMQKESFKSKLLSEFDTNTSTIATVEDLKEKASTIFGKAPESLPPITVINYGKIIGIENDEILGKKIIGKSDVDISRIIQKLNLNDWVNQGRSFIKIDNICPFCQQPTITEEFKKQLEDYFDESYTASLKEIASLSDEYNRISDNLTNELMQIETSQKSNSGTKLEIDKFTAYLKTLSSQVNENKVLLGEKVKEPSRSIKLTSTKEQFDNIIELIAKANREIQKHNDIVLNFKSERSSLIKSIWKYLVEENKADIEAHKKNIAGLDKGISLLNKDVAEKRNAYVTLNNEIKELTKNVTSIQPTIDEINKILQYYGFDNFEIVPSESSENYYQIKRENGELAESTLSEGEITFITFLYFLQLAKGSTKIETITEERILVIDDPISSLDSNVLFVVSTLIKEIIKDIKANIGNVKQLILLTHNVYFHKEVSFIDGRTKQHNQTNFWILRKKNKISSAQPFLMKNPIQTSYELLWNEIKNKEHNSSVTIQNTIRRIIENYFKMLGGYKDDDLISKFTSKEEQEIFRSLISWVNDGSHSISDDLFVESESDVVDKYLKVFKDIFILTKNKGHYDMMMGNQDAANN
ncbi:MAG: AAA family ATPase [Pseudohongiella sp.]|nr:AAA family ATPase [Pseudohongiella sp.]